MCVCVCDLGLCCAQAFSGSFRVCVCVCVCVAVLGLCCAQAFSGCSGWVLLSNGSAWLLIAVASLVGEHGF